MTQREKVLSWIVGGVLFFVLNIVAIKFLMRNRDTIAVAREQIEGKIRGLKQQESQREMWAARNKWLDQTMQPIGDSDVATQALRDALQNLAKKYTVTLEAPQPGVPLKQATHTVLSVKVDAKAPWQQMFDFIQELQAPGQFISVDGNLKVDAADKTQLKVSLTVSKWFQP
jgi:hypothetical protein